MSNQDRKTLSLYNGTAASPNDITLDGFSDLLRTHLGPKPVVLFPTDEGMAQVFGELSRLVPKMFADKRQARHEDRIAQMLDSLLDFDPLDLPDTRIDLRNAEQQRDFLLEFPVLDAATVHRRAGRTGANAAQTANNWRKARRIFGLPVQGRTAYPEFQFDADGQPLPMLKPVLAILADSRTPWQIAFWMVAPNEWLDGETPLDVIQAGDTRAEQAAYSDLTPMIG